MTSAEGETLITSAGWRIGSPGCKKLQLIRQCLTKACIRQETDIHVVTEVWVPPGASSFATCNLKKLAVYWKWTVSFPTTTGQPTGCISVDLWQTFQVGAKRSNSKCSRRTEGEDSVISKQEKDNMEQAAQVAPI